MNRSDANRPKQPSSNLQPQPNSILRQPATVAACQQDYADAADIRARLDQQIKNRR